MTSIQKAQLEFLNETAEFYNLDNRCEVDGICKYHIDGKMGCAIGRKVTDLELKKKFDTYTNTGVDNKDIFNALPQELKELGQSFLSHMQDLHDDDFNWDVKGLTKSGQKSVQRIKDVFGLIEI